MKKVFPVLMSICGVAIVSYGVSAVAISRYVDMQTHSVWWAQVLACLLGGAGLVALPGLKKIFQKEVPQPEPEPEPEPEPGPGPRPKPKPTPTPVPVPTPAPIPTPVPDAETIDSMEQADLAALHHLATRLLETPEGLALCRQLQDCVFELHHGSLDITDGGTQLFESSIKTNDNSSTLSRSVVFNESDQIGNSA